MTALVVDFIDYRLTKSLAKKAGKPMPSVQDQHATRKDVIIQELIAEFENEPQVLVALACEEAAKALDAGCNAWDARTVAMRFLGLK